MTRPHPGAGLSDFCGYGLVVGWSRSLRRCALAVAPPLRGDAVAVSEAPDEIGGVAQAGPGCHYTEWQIGLAQHPPDLGHASLGDPFEQGAAGSLANHRREVARGVPERPGDVRNGDWLAERRLDLVEHPLHQRVRR